MRNHFTLILEPVSTTVHQILNTRSVSLRSLANSVSLSVNFLTISRPTQCACQSDGIKSTCIQLFLLWSSCPRALINWRSFPSELTTLHKYSNSNCINIPWGSHFNNQQTDGKLKASDWRPKPQCAEHYLTEQLGGSHCVTEEVFVFLHPNLFLLLACLQAIQVARQVSSAQHNRRRQLICLFHQKYDQPSPASKDSCLLAIKYLEKFCKHWETNSFVGEMDPVNKADGSRPKLTILLFCNS